MEQVKKNQNAVPGKKNDMPERGDKKHISPAHKTTKTESDLASKNSSNRDDGRRNEKNERHENERTSR